MICWAPSCPFEPAVWPTVLIGREGGGAPYRLEVPRAVCRIHAPAFAPSHFLSPEARARIEGFATEWGTGDPDWQAVTLEWTPLNHPTFVELDGTEARFCAPA